MRIVLVFSLAVLAFGTGAHAESEDPMLSRIGADLYVQHCAACHGLTGVGDGPVAGSLRTAPADLTRIAARRGGQFPDSEIARFIDGRFDVPAHGTREMPIWGRQLGESIGGGTEPDEVARGRILSLVEYLKSIQKP